MAWVSGLHSGGGSPRWPEEFPESLSRSSCSAPLYQASLFPLMEGSLVVSLTTEMTLHGRQISDPQSHV